MSLKECSEVMEKANIRPTSIRILVYEVISNLDNTFSLSDLEQILETVDKSTIFRTLTIFEKHRLIHRIDDGSGYIKYCLCHNHGDCQEVENHYHFYCESCNKTYCLEEQVLPEISLPKGFEMRNVNYVIKGLCASCTKKK